MTTKTIPATRANIDYSYLLKTVSGKSWKDIGGARRLSGVASPAFSLHTKENSSCDYSVLKRAIDYCHETKTTIFQLLPMNWAGYANAPYMAESGFALDPFYLSLRDVKGLKISFEEEIKTLDRKPDLQVITLANGSRRVNYGTRNAKLELSWEMFKSRNWNDEKDFLKFKHETAKYWLDGFALYKVLKEINGEKSWLDWDMQHRNGDPDALEKVLRKHEDKYEFHRWLQWQLFEQAKDLKSYATNKGILIMGDLPFLPARDSAEVWLDHVRGTNNFNLDLQAGALPDMYFADGQLWGNPPPNWDKMESNDFKYIRQKRRYASNFYHIERKDHEIGQFRLYINPLNAASGKSGWFLPDGKIGDEKSEIRWKEHGQKLITMQILDPESSMLYTSEGLGTPPKYMQQTLDDLGVPNIYVQRWTKRGAKFVDANPLGVGTTSTHDCALKARWWEEDAGTIDRGMFENMCKSADISPEELINKLFDPSSSSCARLRWKKDLTGDKPELKAVEGLNTEFENTFSEKQEFLSYLDLELDPETPASAELIRAALEKSAYGQAIFDVPSIFDVESLDPDGLKIARDNRLNLPGNCDGNLYWNLQTGRSLDQMLEDDEYIKYLRALHINSNRC